MKEEERRWLNRLIADPDALKSSAFAASAQAASVCVGNKRVRLSLMCGSEISKEEVGAPFREKNKSILAARSRFKVVPTDLPIEPYVKRPDLGHGTSRMGNRCRLEKRPGFRRNQSARRLS